MAIDFKMFVRYQFLTGSMLCLAYITTAGAQPATNPANIDYNATASYMSTINGGGNVTDFQITLNTGYRMFTSVDANVTTNAPAKSRLDFWIDGLSGDVQDEHCKQNFAYGVCATYIAITNASLLAEGQNGAGSCQSIITSDCVRSIELETESAFNQAVASGSSDPCASLFKLDVTKLPTECSLSGGSSSVSVSQGQ